jgi:hypothetical protein
MDPRRSPERVGGVNRPATESADKNRNDETQEREHAGDTTAAHPKTLDFSTRLGFSVATAPRALRKLHVAAPRRPNSACDLRFAAALIGGVRCARYRGVGQTLLLTGSAGVICTRCSEGVAARSSSGRNHKRVAGLAFGTNARVEQYFCRHPHNCHNVRAMVRRGRSGGTRIRGDQSWFVLKNQRDIERLLHLLRRGQNDATTTVVNGPPRP